MGNTFISLKMKRKPPIKFQSVASMKSKIEMDLALGAGTTKVKSIDPIYHITESFRSTFEQSGQDKASQFVEKNDRNSIQEQRQEEPDQTTFGQEFPYNKSTTEEKARGDFYGRFSEIAFQNGRLASAVLQNSGQTMFVLCMKRALGQSEPTYSMKSKLFSKSSEIAPLRNSLAKVVCNRYTNSAIGLVVESILSARQTLQLFERLASDDSEKAVPGMKDNIIRNVYPFLIISKDAERLVEYEEKLSELTLLEGNTRDCKERNEIGGQKAVLVAGIAKTQGLIMRKRQLQNQFFDRLEQLLENSRKAEAFFTAPGFADNVVEELMDSLELPEDDRDDPNDDKPEEPSGKSEK